MQVVDWTEQGLRVVEMAQDTQIRYFLNAKRMQVGRIINYPDVCKGDSGKSPEFVFDLVANEYDDPQGQTKMMGRVHMGSVKVNGISRDYFIENTLGDLTRRRVTFENETVASISTVGKLMRNSNHIFPMMSVTGISIGMQVRGRGVQDRAIVSKVMDATLKTPIGALEDTDFEFEVRNFDRLDVEHDQTVELMVGEELMECTVNGTKFKIKTRNKDGRFDVMPDHARSTSVHRGIRMNMESDDGIVFDDIATQDVDESFVRLEFGSGPENPHLQLGPNGEIQLDGSINLDLQTAYYRCKMDVVSTEEFEFKQFTNDLDLEFRFLGEALSFGPDGRRPQSSESSLSNYKIHVMWHQDRFLPTQSSGWNEPNRWNPDTCGSVIHWGLDKEFNRPTLRWSYVRSQNSCLAEQSGNVALQEYTIKSWVYNNDGEISGFIVDGDQSRSREDGLQVPAS